MNNINASQLSAYTKLPFQKREMEIQKHVAWHGLISSQEAETLLKGKPSLTYLLRATEKPYQFFLSFVSQDGAVCHQVFDIEQNMYGWIYRNGDIHIEQTLEGLIPAILHCSVNECTPLDK